MARIPSMTTAEDRWSNASKKRPRDNKTSGANNTHGLLVMQYNGSIDCTDGLRRGFNGKAGMSKIGGKWVPTRCVALSDTIVTRADGSQRTIERGTKTYNGRKTTTTKTTASVSKTEALLQSLPSIHA